MPRKELEDGHLGSKLCFSKNSWEIGAGEKIGTIFKNDSSLGERRRLTSVLSDQQIGLKEKDWVQVHPLSWKIKHRVGRKKLLSTSQQLLRGVRTVSTQARKLPGRLNYSHKDPRLATKQGGFELNLSPKCYQIYANNFYHYPNSLQNSSTERKTILQWFQSSPNTSCTTHTCKFTCQLSALHQANGQLIWYIYIYFKKSLTFYCNNIILMVLYI